jgi:tetratricopeptide (TPR) repeat protein
VNRCMACLQQVLGQADEAVELYEEALDAVDALGALPTLARIQLELAPLLVRSGDHQRATELLRESAAIAEERSMAGVAAKAGALLATRS